MNREELYLGVDLGGVSVRAAVVDATGHVLGQEKHRLLSKEPPQVAEAVLRAAKTACGAAGMPFSEMKGMGLGVAGMIDREQDWSGARRPWVGATSRSSSCCRRARRGRLCGSRASCRCPLG